MSATGSADVQVSGGSFKIICDTQDWDSSLGMSNPGQSGDPASPHYRDLYALWSADRYFPICYSRARVDSVVESVLTLKPSGGKAP